MSKKTGRSKYALLEHSSKRSCDVAASATVGRENTDLVFPALTGLSRKHFQIIIDSDGAWIEDLGSSNGTRLNGTKLQPHVREPLANGDSIIAGRAVFTFQIRAIGAKRGTNSRIEIEESEEASRPEKGSHRLAPEISLVGIKKPLPRELPLGPDAVYYEDDELTKKEKKKKKKKKGSSAFTGLSQQWSTLLLAAALGTLAFVEIDAIRVSPYTFPHSAKELTLRYLFSVGLMYLTVVLVQAVLVATVARRWYFAVLALVPSLIVGGFAGDKFEEYAEFQKAELENRLHTSKQKKISNGTRSPSNQKDQ